jgi:hypothetical protein
VQWTTRALGAVVAGLLVAAVVVMTTRDAPTGATRLAVSSPAVAPPTTVSTSPAPTEPAPAEPPVDTRPTIPYSPAPSVPPAPPSTVATRAFSLAPTTGRISAPVVVSGTGCTGPEAGVGIAYLDRSGQIGADGGMAASDGNWSFPISVPPTAPGVVTIEAFCFNATTNALYFSYVPQTFIVLR